MAEANTSQPSDAAADPATEASPAAGPPGTADDGGKAAGKAARKAARQEKKAARKAARKEKKATRAALGGNRPWFVPVMLGLMLAGLVWTVIYYLSAAQYPVGSLGNWNLAIGFGFIMAGFLMTTQWK